MDYTKDNSMYMFTLNQKQRMRQCLLLYRKLKKPTIKQKNSDQINPDQTNPDQTNPDQTNSDQINPDQTNSDQTRPDQINIQYDKLKSDYYKSLAEIRDEYIKKLESMIDDSLLDKK
jgi:hypothetical protein